MTTRWALLGHGRHAARNVVSQLKRAAGGELVGVMGRDAGRAGAFAREHGIAKVFTSLDEVLADPGIDAIYDTTPDGLHAGNAKAAARAGKHALIDKPLANTIEDALQVVETCRHHGVKLGVVFNQRHEEVHQAARRIVLAGEIGDVMLAYVPLPLRGAGSPAPPPTSNWRADPKMRPGGMVLGIGDHACDTLSYLVGQEIDEVSAFTDATQQDPPNDRLCGILLKLSKGTIGYATAGAKTPFSRRPFEIHGTKGSLIIENSFAYLTGAGADPRPSLTLVNEAGTNVSYFASTECFRLEAEQFNRAIAGQGEPMTTGEQAVRILALRDATYAAAREGRVARVSEFLPT